MKKLILLLFSISSTILAQESYLLQINRLRLPFNNEGVLANVSVSGVGQGELDSIGFLFSAGFFLSGKNNDTVWANGVATASRIQDYQPGNVDSIPYDPKYGIYVIEGPAFGNSWQKWRYAVANGADFYDGNGDGVYDPLDLNGNNQWDRNEDRPDIIGGFTAWCVYNDGVATEDRAFEGEPMGIEIQQTVFAFYSYYADNKVDPRASTFFVRYKIINTGKVSDVFDSVYFGSWADTDLGGSDGYIDDLAGCDTLQNSGYVYNEGYDYSFGINPPAHFIKILQGPYSYIPAETFIDNNTNGEYDEGADTPLDTAFNFKGEPNGVDTLSGAKNLGMTSFIHYEKGVGDPDNQQQARNYLQGKEQYGDDYDPCSWRFGVTHGVNCDEINPVFMYSGDPVTQTGWINNYDTDQRQLASSGPFTLEIGKPVTIIIAHIAGRGTDSLNSITVSREFSEAIEGFYKSNFTNIVVSVDDEAEEFVPSSFQLLQNYPNPFNPTTNIGFRIANFPEGTSGFVSLKVYDILGREIATLVNGEKPAGSYEVEFDASALSSGIYFYKLQTEQYSLTKKMLLLK